MLNKIKTIIFDLDNTLFDTEGQITDASLKSAIKQMIKKGLKTNKEIGFKEIKKIIEDNPSSDKFKILSEKYNGDRTIYLAGKNAYYSYEFKKISLFPNTKKVLQKLKREYKLILITFGNPQTQYRKIKNLDIEKFFEDIILTSNHNKEEAFLKAINRNKLNEKETICVGDRLDSEIRIANKFGMTTVRMLHGKYKKLKPHSNLEKPNYSITQISQLEEII